LLKENPSRFNAQITAHAREGHLFLGSRILGLNKRIFAIVDFEVFR